MAEFRILSASVFFACLLILILLATHPEGKLRYNRFLIVSFLFLSIHQLAVTLEENAVISFELVRKVGLFSLLMYLPAFWIYIRDLKEKKTNFFAHYVFWLIAFGLAITEQKIQSIDIPYFATYLFVGSLATYLILNTRELTSQKFWATPIVKKWAYPFVATFIAIDLIYVTEAIFIFQDIVLWKSAQGSWANWYYYIVHLIFCLMIIVNMVQNPSLFTNYRLVRKYAQNKELINKSEVEVIQKVVITERLFLNPDFNRNLLSEITGLSVNRISEIINGHYQTKFPDWINDLRVDHATQLLMQNDLSIKEVFNQSGFNSKSAFNTAFKNRKGVTPTAFRKKK